MNEPGRLQRNASSPASMAPQFQHPLQARQQPQQQQRQQQQRQQPQQPQHHPLPHRHHQRIVGEYVLTRPIGSGSFATVWKAHHRLNGCEFAIKEIVAEKLNTKLQESLMCEIEILKRTNHPNIIRLHDTILAPHRIYLVLEYCSGGDLAAYIQRHGRVSESVARHFMCQLGAGLQVLRANNLIHRDLKPQNLLLSTNDGNAVLKIADFGFARSLQPQRMAETLCGSPLYMAPEILSSKRYDAKADLWSVGTILYQLVTGETPYVGQSPVQLLQNIQKSTELHFPPAILSDLHADCIDLCQKLLRKDPVERLSFEEFFNHRFIAQTARHEPEFPVVDASLSVSSTSKSLQEESLPFLLDEDPQAPPSPSLKQAASPPFSFLHRPAEGLPRKCVEKKDVFIPYTAGREIHDNHGNVEANPKARKATFTDKAITNIDQDIFQASPSKVALLDSMECLEREYVLVNVPVSSTYTMSPSASDHSPGINPERNSVVAVSKPSEVASMSGLRSIGSPSSLSGASSAELADAASTLAQLRVRLECLQRYAEVITDVANERFNAGQPLEAFSTQLVCLAVWKEALEVSQKWTELGVYLKRNGDVRSIETLGEECAIESTRSQVEQSFVQAVEQAEAFAPHLHAVDGSAEVPDAIEILYQNALSRGRNAAVDELMGNTVIASATYSEAALLLQFILTEALVLPVTPRVTLSPDVVQCLHHFIDILVTRHSQCAGDLKVE